MKNKFIVTACNDHINFFLVCREGRFYLFSQRFTKGVYDYFRNGRSESELYKFRCWDRNPRLDHTIDKCLDPSYRRAAMDDERAF